MHIAIIGANDQIVTISKDINCRLDSDKLKKLIKDKQGYPPIGVQLV
jgi:hypothetical protein